MSLPHGCCAWCSSKAAWVVQWRRGSAVHLSRALELISVQINCFSCILVTGISLRLSGLLGGRRGDVRQHVYCAHMCVLVTHFLLQRSERSDRLRGQEPPDWCVCHSMSLSLGPLILKSSIGGRAPATDGTINQDVSLASSLQFCLKFFKTIFFNTVTLPRC